MYNLLVKSSKITACVNHTVLNISYKKHRAQDSQPLLLFIIFQIEELYSVLARPYCYQYSFYIMATVID